MTCIIVVPTTTHLIFSQVFTLSVLFNCLLQDCTFSSRMVAMVVADTFTIETRKYMELISKQRAIFTKSELIIYTDLTKRFITTTTIIIWLKKTFNKVTGIASVQTQIYTKHYC